MDLPIEVVEEDRLLYFALSHLKSRCTSCSQYQILGSQGLCSSCTRDRQTVRVNLCPACNAVLHKVCTECGKLSSKMTPQMICVECADELWEVPKAQGYELKTCTLCSQSRVVGRSTLVRGLICFNCHMDTHYANCEKCGFTTLGGKCTCHEQVTS